MADPAQRMGMAELLEHPWVKPSADKCRMEIERRMQAAPPAAAKPKNAVVGGAAASSSAATAMPPLSEACEVFKRELGVDGKSLVDVVDATCEQLGITDVKGVSLMQKAEKCWVCIKGQ